MSRWCCVVCPTDIGFHKNPEQDKSFNLEKSLISWIPAGGCMMGVAYDSFHFVRREFVDKFKEGWKNLGKETFGMVSISIVESSPFIFSLEDLNNHEEDVIIGVGDKTYDYPFYLHVHAEYEGDKVKYQTKKDWEKNDT